MKVLGIYYNLEDDSLNSVLIYLDKKGRIQSANSISQKELEEYLSGTYHIFISISKESWIHKTVSKFTKVDLTKILPVTRTNQVFYQYRAIDSSDTIVSINRKNMIDNVLVLNRL